jgi:hypothetical protein
MRALDSLRFDSGVLGNRKQEALVRHHVVQNAGEEGRVGGGLANRLWPDACCGKELPEALRVACEQAERRNGEIFREIP